MISPVLTEVLSLDGFSVGAIVSTSAFSVALTVTFTGLEKSTLVLSLFQ